MSDFYLSLLSKLFIMYSSHVNCLSLDFFVGQ